MNQEMSLELGDDARARIADLIERYHAERASVVSAAIIAGPCRQDVCRYCGGRWIMWFNSKADGHVQCLVGADFKRLVRDVWNSDPLITMDGIADSLGVSISVVRAWIERVIATAARKAGTNG